MAQHLEFSAVFAAPPEIVFAFFSDHERLGRLWGGRWKRVAPGANPNAPNGLGSIREVRAGAFKWQERITVFQPEHLIEYEILSGAPIKSHHARIAFTRVEGGTKVDYSVRFDPKIPLTGGMFAATMRLSWTIGVPKVSRELEQLATGA